MQNMARKQRKKNAKIIYHTAKLDPFGGYHSFLTQGTHQKGIPGQPEQGDVGDVVSLCQPVKDLSGEG